jgi:hypothetical protein
MLRLKQMLRRAIAERLEVHNWSYSKMRYGRGTSGGA